MTSGFLLPLGRLNLASLSSHERKEVVEKFCTPFCTFFQPLPPSYCCTTFKNDAKNPSSKDKITACGSVSRPNINLHKWLPVFETCWPALRP